MVQLWILAQIPDCACLDVQILGPKRNLDHRSFFSLGQYVSQFIQIISFFERSSIKLWCETVIGIVLCYNHEACCLLYCLCGINNGIHIIHIYQFTFELLHFCFRMWLWFQIWTKILAEQWIWWKKGTDRQIGMPLFTPSFMLSTFIMVSWLQFILITIAFLHILCTLQIASDQ